VAVQFGVVTAGLGMMLFGVAGVTVRGVGVVRRLFMIAGFMVPGGFTVMLRGMLVVFRSLVMMFDVGVFAHVTLPVMVRSRSGVRKLPDAVLTVMRQLCCS
jgi:hypothetical protein